MNVTLKQLKVFLEVARVLSFAKAGEALHLSQPAVSLSVQSLEKSIGGKLFVRSTKSLSLTPEGQFFKKKCERLYDDWTTLLDDTHSLFTMKRGKLSLVAMPSFCDHSLPRILELFHEQYPHLNLYVRSSVMEDAIELVRRDRCEIAICFRADDMSGVEFFPLYRDTFTVIYNADYHDLSEYNLYEDWQPLYDFPMVAMESNSTVRKWIEACFSRDQKKPCIKAEVNQLSFLARLVKKGLGIGVVPSICCEEMHNMGLQMQTLSPQLLSQELGVVCKSQHTLSNAATAMMKLLTQQLKD